MEFELIFPKKNSGDTIKTRLKVTNKELQDQETRLYLKLKGVDLDNTNKVSSRYTYFIVDGDLINKKK